MPLNNNFFLKFQPLVIVTCMVVVIVTVFVKYIPLYHIHHMHGNFNNKSDSSTENNNNTVVSPSIKSPVVFLLVNFVYFYTILVIVICLYGLYKRPKSKSSCDDFSSKPYEIEIVVASTESSQSCTDDEETIIRVNSFPVKMSHASNVSNYRNTWPGDWNKYWNSKCDY